MRGKTILFYDPDPRACRVAERALNATGSDVDVASDEKSLHERIEANGYDLMMVNFDPPMRDDESWAETLDTVEARWPRTRLVLHATASTEDYLPLMASLIVGLVAAGFSGWELLLAVFEWALYCGVGVAAISAVAT